MSLAHTKQYVEIARRAQTGSAIGTGNAAFDLPLPWKTIKVGERYAAYKVAGNSYGSRGFKSRRIIFQGRTIKVYTFDPKAMNRTLSVSSRKMPTDWHITYHKNCTQVGTSRLYQNLKVSERKQRLWRAVKLKWPG